MIADTTLLIDLLRNDPSAKRLVERLEAEGQPLWIPSPALFELWEGVERSDRPDDEIEKIERVFADYTVLDLSAPHAARAGRLSGERIRRGRMMDPLDAQIAGCALEEGQSLITRNAKDFARISGLKVLEY